MDWISIVESRLPQPAATIFLDLPVESLASLMKSRQRAMDMHELNKPYLEATWNVYQALSRRPGWIKVSCSSGKGPRPIQEIHEEVWEKLKKLV